MVKVGVVLGRFQPFHNGHLSYFLLALKNTKSLIIGITTPGKKPTRYEPKNPLRFGKENNPFSFSQRREMIKAALKTRGVNLKRIRFIHFMPQKLKIWQSQVPSSATYFLILRPSDSKQVSEMKAQGLNIKILKVIKEDKYKGFNVRRLLKDDSNWEALVPKPVADYINRLRRHEKKLKIA